MKAIKDGTKKRKYYKWTSWTQPKLTSASGSGFTTYESSHYGSWAFWNVFQATPSQWHSGSGMPQWCAWSYTNPLKITKLAFIGNGNGNIADFQVQASDDNATWTTLKTVNNTVTTGNFTVDLSSNTKGYKYYRLYITRGYYTAGGHDNIALISGITITATQLVEGTASDYSYYEETDVYKLPTTITRYYYKNWTQPTLTSNTSNSGLVISDHRSASDAYKSFDSDTTTTGWSVQGSAGSFSGKSYWLQMKFSIGLNVTNLAITNRNVSGTTQAITKGSVQISNDGSTWIKTKDWTNSNTTGGAVWNIPLSYTGYYKYIRLYVTDATTSNNGNNILVMNIKLTATAQGSSSDYSYYEDVPVYHLVKE